MKKVVALSMLVMSCACSTVGEVRESPAIVEASSLKDVNSIAGCVSEIWSRQKGGTVNTMIIPKGVAISVGSLMYSSPVTAAVLDITDEGSHRRIVMRTGRKNMKPEGIEASRKEITPCL